MRDTLSTTDARHYAHSSSFKMALFFTVMLGGAVILLGYFGYYFSHHRFVAEAEDIIAVEMRYLVLADDARDLTVTLSHVEKTPGRVYLLLDKGGQKVAGNLDGLLTSVSVLDEGTLLFTLPDQYGQTRAFAARIHTFADGRRLLVGIDITDLSFSYAVMKWLSFLSIVFMIVVIVTSFVISTFVVSRTNRIALTAQEIMDTGDLSRRIAIDSRWDDLSNMAYVLNSLLARIESLMQGIRQVSDNIAHDLRTPLTRLRNHLETLRSQDQNHQMQPGYEAMISEADHLLNTFNALLRIARIETGKQTTQFILLDLRQLICDVIDFYEPLAEEKDIVISSQLTEMDYHGDRDLLFQAMANVLDNAIKFTPTGGTISVVLTTIGGQPHLIIRDSGPGIEEAEQDKVFDRFYRAESSRTTPGNGLGLSLVAAVIALHKGRISLRNLAPGLEICFRL